MDYLVEILVPIFICCVLPVSIVLIVFLTKINRDNKSSKVLIEAIKCNPGMDADKLATALKKPEVTPRERLHKRLLNGCCFTLVGIALAVIIPIFYNTLVEEDILLLCVLCAAIFLAIGAAYVIVYFVTRKSIEGCDDTKEA